MSIKVKATELLHGQLLADFEEFLAFLKSEKMTVSKIYGGYRIKYKGEGVSGMGIGENSFGFRVYIGGPADFGVYLEGQSDEFIGAFMQSLEHKCNNCRDGRTGCSRNLGGTFTVDGKAYKNICLGAFGEFVSCDFSVEGDINNMKHNTTKRLVPFGSVKKLILVRKAHIMKSQQAKEEAGIEPEAELKLTQAEMEEKFRNAVKNLVPRSKTVEVDLAEMRVCGKVDYSFEDGYLTLRNASGEKGVYFNNGGTNSLETMEKFSGAIKVEMRAATDKYDIWIYYNKGSLVLAQRTKMYKSYDPASGREKYHMPPRKIQADEFIGIEWYIAPEFMAILVDGEVWYYGEQHDYIERFRETPPNPAPVRISALATPKTVVTVESLRITEI